MDALDNASIKKTCATVSPHLAKRKSSALLTMFVFLRGHVTLGVEKWILDDIIGAWGSIYKAGAGQFVLRAVSKQGRKKGTL